MAEKGQKRFYWLKLHKDFFNQVEVKRLRSVAGGETFCIIYLEMLLISLETNGYLVYEGYCDTFAQELALRINESADNVRITVDYLLCKGLLEERDESSFFLTKVPNMVGSECASASRVRRYRENKKIEENSKSQLLEENSGEMENPETTLIDGNCTLHCNNDVTACNSETLHCNTSVTNCNVEKEKEKREIKKANAFFKSIVQKNLHETDNEKSDDVESVENLSDTPVRESDIEFERLWQLYPRKRNKHIAKAAYAKALRSGVTNAEIEAGIIRYCQYVLNNNKDREFIMLGSTWFENKCWEDEFTEEDLKPKGADNKPKKQTSYDLSKVRPAFENQS